MEFDHNYLEENSSKLSSKAYISLCIITVSYVWGSMALQDKIFGVNSKWLSAFFFTAALMFFINKKHILIIKQPSTILFMLFTIIEAINVLTNVSNNPSGVATLFFMGFMSFTFYSLSLPILQLILAYIYYSVISLILLSAFQGLSGITILQLSPEITGEFIETNNLQEQIIRFRGVFENPNILAIYSLLVICWVLGIILSSNLKTSSNLTNFVRFIFLLLVGAASLYCGIETHSLQYPAGLVLVLIALRFFAKFKKLSFRRLLFEVAIAVFTCLSGFYFFNLYLITPQERSNARAESFIEVFLQTDRWYLTGYGYGQNREDVTIDIGPGKWLIELGVFSLLCLIIHIIHTLIIFNKVRNKNSYSNVTTYYIYYINIIANWLFQNVIYSPLYITTTIWIILSVMIHKMEINYKNSQQKLS